MYTLDEIRELIGGYNWRMNLIENQVYEYDSTSTAQYGMESCMPKGQGETGDKVLVRVMRNDRDRREMTRLIEKVSFIDEHEQHIKSDKDYHILQLLKRGYGHKTIMELLPIGKDAFYNRLRAIVEMLYETQKNELSDTSDRYDKTDTSDRYDKTDTSDRYDKTDTSDTSDGILNK
ncbi:hypothetical protein [Staphylococcus succinus]|uniref:hypothetical protein n=1 Tax=Staphylococcus succinus TaxID=61015 RepID=UPI001C043098|nr:hypothetical protein [Staphylococcus succinus]MBU0437769.1 hypothetical protein [Staphylococcus succinus]